MKLKTCGRESTKNEPRFVYHCSTSIYYSSRTWKEYAVISVDTAANLEPGDLSRHEAALPGAGQN